MSGCKIVLLVLLCGLPLAFSSTCHSCSGSCSPPSNGSALCRCDRDCQYFGDCCGGVSRPSSCPPSELPPLQDGAKMECRSSFVWSNKQVIAEGEAYLMISSCPNTWRDPANTSISQNCSSLSDWTRSLPPVTDIRTGLVYKNEFCARCNGVNELLAWETSLACSYGVYQRLDSISVAALLKEDPHIFKNNCTECTFKPPNVTTIARQPRSCIPSENICLPISVYEIIRGWVDESTYNDMVEDCRSGPLDLVKDWNNIIYRNPACARCNGNDYEYDCFQLEASDMTTRNNLCLSDTGGIFAPFDFTITLSNVGKGQVEITTGENHGSIQVECPDGEVPVGLTCRQTLCPEGYSVTGGRCSFASPLVPVTAPAEINATEFKNCSTTTVAVNDSNYSILGDDTILLEDNSTVVDVLYYDHLDRPVICLPNNTGVTFLNCTTSFVQLEESQYVDFGNGTIQFETLVIDVVYWENGRPLVCHDRLNSTGGHAQFLLYDTNLPGIEVLSYVGCTLSVIGTVAVLVTYFIFSELHTFPGMVLMNLCVTILATNLLFLAGGPTVKVYHVKQLCSTLAISLHFFYLAQFAWMSIFSCEMLRNFYQARQFSQDSTRAKKRFFVIYFVIGWLPPLAISTVTIALNFSMDSLILYGVDDKGDVSVCWINHFYSLLVTFLLPLLLSLLCNLIMFVITTVLLCRASWDQCKLEKSNNSTIIRVWLAVFSITGLTWIFGFLALSKSMNWMWYPFVIFNSTNGVFIFLAFIFTRKVFNLYVELLTGTRRRKNTLSFRNRSSASIRSNSSLSMQRKNTGTFKTTGSFRTNGSFKTSASFKTNGSFKSSGSFKANRTYKTKVSIEPTTTNTKNTEPLKTGVDLV